MTSRGCPVTSWKPVVATSRWAQSLSHIASGQSVTPALEEVAACGGRRALSCEPPGVRQRPVFKFPCAPLLASRAERVRGREQQPREQRSADFVRNVIENHTIRSSDRRAWTLSGRRGREQRRATASLPSRRRGGRERNVRNGDTLKSSRIIGRPTTLDDLDCSRGSRSHAPDVRCQARGRRSEGAHGAAAGTGAPRCLPPRARRCAWAGRRDGLRR